MNNDLENARIRRASVVPGNGAEHHDSRDSGTDARVFREEKQAHLYALIGGKSQDDFLVQGRVFKKDAAPRIAPRSVEDR